MGYSSYNNAVLCCVRWCFTGTRFGGARQGTVLECGSTRSCCADECFRERALRNPVNMYAVVLANAVNPVV